jgi:hypothetical protein
MPRRAFAGILMAAAVLAVVTARPYAGGWNDGSRLATVESLVARSTFQIDESIYVAVPEHSPYTPGDKSLARHGTGDKLLIDGRFYSDKSPVPAVVMAGVYQVARWVGLPSAADRPDWFARVMTWLFAGLPYLLAVWCVGRTIGRIGLSDRWAIALTAGFAFGLALPYVQHVNNHILLLAVAAGVCDLLLRPPPMTGGRALVIGALAGLGYTIDLGAGPPMLLAAIGYLAWIGRGQGQRPVMWAAVGAIPLFVAHHALNYAIGGTFAPANANPEYLRWPGSTFSEATMTGVWNHPSLWKAGLYALELLGGKKGFFLYAPPLLMLLTGAYCLVFRPSPERPALIALYAWMTMTWLAYAATSRNLSGVCLSVRWFIPLLAPGFVAIAVLARESPARRPALAVLLVGGWLLVPEFVWRGPWSGRIPVTYWPVVGATLAVWGTLSGRRFLRARRSKRRQTSVPSAGTGPHELSPTATPG